MHVSILTLRSNSQGILVLTVVHKVNQGFVVISLPAVHTWKHTVHPVQLLFSVRLDQDHCYLKASPIFTGVQICYFGRGHSGTCVSWSCLAGCFESSRWKVKRWSSFEKLFSSGMSLYLASSVWGLWLRNIETHMTGHLCFHSHPVYWNQLHYYLLLRLSLTFCRLLTDTVRISSIPPCQVKSICSNGIPIPLSSTALVPVPSGADRSAGNDFLGFDLDPEGKRWLDSASREVCLLLISFSTYWCFLTQLTGLLCLFRSVRGVRLLFSSFILSERMEVWPNCCN